MIMQDRFRRGNPTVFKLVLIYKPSGFISRLVNITVKRDDKAKSWSELPRRQRGLPRLGIFAVRILIVDIISLKRISDPPLTSPTKIRFCDIILESDAATSWSVHCVSPPIAYYQLSSYYTLHNDLQIPFITEEIKRYSTLYYNRLDTKTVM
jgi:hypothetical protein